MKNDVSDISIAHPACHDELIGFEREISEFESAFASSQIHHAWLITGPKGIGKATLAFRFARFVLSDKAENVSSLNGNTPAARKIAAKSHPNLLLIERASDEKTGKQKTEITVDVVRKTTRFLGSTAAQGGWRVIIVDCADELNIAAANALLKNLEEPPARTIFFLVSHRPGSLLSTIRSRCRVLALRNHSQARVLEILQAHLGEQLDLKTMQDAAHIAKGSVGRAMQLLCDAGIDLNADLSNIIYASQPDWNNIHQLASKLASRDVEQNFDLFVSLWMDRVSDLVQSHIASKPCNLADMKHMAEFHQYISDQAGQVIALNLDKKQFILSLFERWFQFKNRLQTPLES